MKNIIDIYEDSILDIDSTFKQGDNLVKYNDIRELYYSTDRQTLNANWNRFKKNNLNSPVDYSKFKKDKLYIGVSKYDFRINKEYKTITYMGVIRGGENVIHMNANNFINRNPGKFDGEFIHYEPENEHPLGIYQTKKSIFDFKGKFKDIVNSFEWYEVPEQFIPYVEKVILDDSRDPNSKSLWKNKRKIRRKSEYGDLIDL